MAKLAAIEPGFYRIPLPTVLTDSTHGGFDDANAIQNITISCPITSESSAEVIRFGPYNWSECEMRAAEMNGKVDVI